MRHFNVRVATRGLLMTVAIWTVLAMAAEWYGAAWPHRQVNVATCFDRVTLKVDYSRCEFYSASYQWQNFILVGIIVEFLLLKSYMMSVMTTRWDWLGRSLVAANLAFSVVYLYTMALLLFPGWGSATWPRDSLRIGLVVVLGFGVLQLLRVPDLEEWDGASERREPTDRRDGWGKQEA